MTGVRRGTAVLLATLMLAMGCALAVMMPSQAHATYTTVTAGSTFSKATSLLYNSNKGLATANETEFNDDNDNNFYTFTTSSRDSSYQLALKVYNSMYVNATVYDSGHHRVATFGTDSTTNYSLTNLKRNSKYYVELWRYADSTSHAQYRIKVKETVTAPAKLSKVTVKALTKKVKVSYVASYNATSYRVAYKKGNGDWVYMNTKKTNFYIKDLVSNRNYTVKIRPYRVVNDVKYWGAWTTGNTVKVK